MESKVLKILIADDDPMLTEMMELILRPYGTCTIVENGRKAVNEFAKALKSDQHFDLVCLDLRMPSMNGIEALKLIREFEKELSIEKKDAAKVIIISNIDDDDTIGNALDSGCEAYIQKIQMKNRLVRTMQRLGLVPKEK